MDIPQDLIVQYIYQYAGYPDYIRANGVYNACCPICREGKSWGKKKRLYFITKDNKFCCHNCQLSWNPLQWMCEVSGNSYFEILKEAEKENQIGISGPFTSETDKKEKKDYPLPFGAINLFNDQEVKYFSDNKVVKDALKLIKERKLDTALNHVDLYISLKDFVYKNRICIPFKQTDGEIIFYQGRAIYKRDEESGRKYISKFGAEKSIFNIDKIDIDFPYIFLFEGPIDSMFVKNGVGVAGLSFTEFQSKQINKFFTHELIWVLDNQRKDEDAMKKSLSLVKRGEKVFVWPKKFQKYKDVNDICVDLGKNHLPPEFFIKRAVNNEASFRSEFF